MVATVSARCVIGVDVGGTKLLAGVVDEELNMRHRAQRSSQELSGPALLDALVAMVTEAAATADCEVAGVGFGVPGVIDRRHGVIAASPHLPLQDVRFQAVMAERLGLPVAVDNDANCAMLAEWRHGAARGANDAVMLTVGTGIGGGVVTGGQLLRGASGGGAELGHMVIQFDGPPCGGDCPGFGHFEWYASGNAIGRAGSASALANPESVLGRQQLAGREITGALVTEVAHDGDAHAVDAVEQVGRVLGLGIVTLVNVFNPEIVVIGGGAVAAGDLLLGPARSVLAEQAMPSMRELARIEPARFGAEAGLLGAATLAFEGLAA